MSNDSYLETVILPITNDISNIRFCISNHHRFGLFGLDSKIEKFGSMASSNSTRLFSCPSWIQNTHPSTYQRCSICPITVEVYLTQKAHCCITGTRLPLISIGDTLRWSVCGYVHGSNELRITVSNTSQRCPMWFRPGNGGWYINKENSLLIYMNHTFVDTVRWS